LSILFAALLAVLILILPWKFWIGERLITIFEAKGFQNVHLTVSKLGLQGIALKNISVGHETPLLENMTVSYSLPDLLKGNMNELAIKGLNLETHQNNDQWIFSGLDGWPPHTANDKINIGIPVTLSQLSTIPLDRIIFEESHLHIASKQWQMDIPILFTLRKNPTPQLSYKSDGLNFKMSDFDIITGKTSLEAILNQDEKKWTGQWQIKDITFKDNTLTVPVIQGNGTLVAYTDNMNFLGKLESADKSYTAEFNIEYALNAPEKSEFILTNASMPWNSGTLSVQNVRVPFFERKAVKANLKVQHASIETLIQMLTGKHASATGTVSGTLPILISENGEITVQQGGLGTEQSGTIIMSPDAIPGDNQQITLVRDILKNFHYTHLSIAVDSNKNNRLSILLALEGNNPDMYQGRPVKLSVHLTGDVLNLVKQNMMPFTNPEQFLK